MVVLDEMIRLRDCAGLKDLLARYVHQPVAEPDAWLDRVMELGGISVKDLCQFHGELIAYGWIEYNPGSSVVRPGHVPNCYRPTAAGRRAWRWSQAQGTGEEEAQREAA
jgi:hypothetical protein